MGCLTPLSSSISKFLKTTLDSYLIRASRMNLVKCIVFSDDLLLLSMRRRQPSIWRKRRDLKLYPDVWADVRSGWNKDPAISPSISPPTLYAMYAVILQIHEKNSDCLVYPFSLLPPPYNSCLISPDSSVWRGLIPVALLAPGYQSSARSRSHRCLRVSDLSVVSCTQPTAVADWAAELCSICVPMHKDALSCPLALLTLTYTFMYGRRSLVFPEKVTTTMKVPISNDDIRHVFKTERQRRP